MKKIITFLCLFILNLGLAQVGINTVTPEPSSILDIVSPNKGMLIPRISLSSTTDVTTVISPIESLMVYNTATVSDVTPGFYFWNGTKWNGLATFDDESGNWKTDGNTVDGSQFLGTINDEPLKIRINNNERFSFTNSGQLLFTNGAIELGANSSASSTEGIGIGKDSNAYGTNAVSMGNAAQSAENAVALGNVANAYGKNSVALGYAALSAENAVGLGNRANAFGNNSVALGNSALSAENAVALGNGAKAHGTNSIALGNNANAFKINSIAIGDGASADSIAVSIGHGAQATGQNSTAIGNGAIVSTANKIRLGNSAVTVIEGQVAFTNPSDGRFKFDVEENIPGLEFIKKLRPVSYKFDRNKLGAFRNEATPAANTEETETGFIAQEVDKVANDLGYHFNGVNKPENLSRDYYTLSYSLFVVPLVKAVQEQQKEIDTLKKEVVALKAFKAEFEAFKAAFQATPQKEHTSVPLTSGN